MHRTSYGESGSGSDTLRCHTSTTVGFIMPLRETVIKEHLGKEIWKKKILSLIHI